MKVIRYEPNWDECNNFTMERDKEGEYVLYKDIKHLLERPDNSGYAASPKLPNYEAFLGACALLDIPYPKAKSLYYKLGNFA